ncbi:unnamed protein product [Caenorhabditis bovis]|uniref:Glutaredoxin domain-containing protein n=1 Tax=Caenorhabditis bovis TaxID=2654633 RepID=A0A8S1F8E0_9PELO|nr:unnamed protein product [Caenorhabditis bovis]
MLIIFLLFASPYLVHTQDDILDQDKRMEQPNVLFQAEKINPELAALFNIEEDASLQSQHLSRYDIDGASTPLALIQRYPRPQNYGNFGGYRPNNPLGYSYVGYINRQSRRYPVMMYTLVQCIPCQRAKHLLAVNYSDVPSHFLELGGNEDWQRQLQVDLLKVTRQATFPYVFVCGQFIGGSTDLFNLHHSGQLRQMLNNCLGRG